jgi:hypothetical protein
MRDNCAKLISTAKIAFTKPKDSVFRGQFENAKTELLKSIRTNVFEASARNKTLNRSLVRQSYENLRKNLGNVSLDQLRDSVDTSGSNTPTSTDVSPRNDLPASPATLPARSPLLRRVGQSQPNPVGPSSSGAKEQYEQQKANVDQQRQQLMNQITSRGAGDEMIKPSNLSLKDKFETLQRQDDPSLKASPGALRSLVSSAGPKLISSPKNSDPKNVFANHIIDGLLDKFPAFKQEWGDRNDADKQSVVQMIIRELAEYQIRILQEKEITGRKASAGKPELPTSLKSLKVESPKDKEKDKDKKRSAAASSGGTLKEKKAKKHRSIREKRKTNQGPESFLEILDEDSATKSSEDKVTKELESIMSANTADWSQLTVKLKSKVRGSVRRTGRKQDVRPMAPSEMTQTSSGLSSSVVDLIGALFEAAGASDEQFDAKMDLLSNHVIKVGDMMKKLVEGLQGSLTNVKEESALQGALNKTTDEMESFPTRGSIDQVDNELIGRGQYSVMIQQLLKEYVYDAGVSIQNMTQQILSDIELLNQYRQGNASSPITLDDTTEAVVLHVVALSITFKQRLAQALNDLETTRYLALERTMNSASDREGLGPRTLSKRESPRVRLAGGDHSVWTDDGETPVNDGSLSPSSLTGPYRAGTINQLIRRLTPEDKAAENVSALLQFNQFQQLPDEESERVGFFRTFLLTYRSFMSAASLLDKLLERYHVPRGKLSAEESLVVKQRVCDVIKFWINEHSYDLDTMLFTKLKYFFDGAVKKDKLDHIAANILEDLGRMVRPCIISRGAH